MLAGAGILVGMYAARETCSTAKILYSIMTALETVSAELTTCLTSFPEVFARLSKMKGAVGAFFTALGENEEETLEIRWNSCLKRHLSVLPGDSMDTLQRLGGLLGHSMADEQQRFLEDAVRQLQGQYERELRQALERGRLYRRICPAVAAALAILLM